MEKSQKGLWSIINKQVFIPPAIVLVAAVAFGIINPSMFNDLASTAFKVIIKYFGWFYAIGSVFLIGFCLWAGLGKYGNIKLGGPEAKPIMSKFNWWAISLCAGLSVGLVFYGVAEPMTHYLNPPPFLGIAPQSDAAAEHALRYTFLHWTFHPYGIYVSSAICIGFAFYNTKLPFKVSSSLYPLMGDRIKGVWGNLIDGLTIFAIVGGVGTSLGFGTMQIAGGLNFLWDIEPSSIVWLSIIVILTIGYTISSYTGLQKGIKLLSQYNAYIYFFLLGWIILFGPTIPILNNTVSAIGDYLANVVPMSFYLDPIGQSSWLNNWTLFYWAWWLAFAPMVGLFLVRLAYGRTLKDFVIVNLIAPACFALLWFGAFGSASIYFDHFLHADIGEMIRTSGIEVSLFALLKHLPFYKITIPIGLLAIIISFITLADSMTSTIASITSVESNDTEAPSSLKIFWGVVMGLLSWVLLVSGGTSALQTSVIVVALPILVLQIFMAFSFIKGVSNLKLYDVVNIEERKNSK